MRTPPNALNVFGTTGAIGTPRSAGSTALAELNRKRLARGTAPAAARPHAKNLRVEPPPMKIRDPRATAIGIECGGISSRRHTQYWSSVSRCPCVLQAIRVRRARQVLSLQTYHYRQALNRVIHLSL